MEDINKFVGIPHYFGQDTFDGCDCLGLCRLFYKQHGWQQTFSDGKPITKDWQKHGGLMRLLKYFRKEFTPTTDVNDLHFGDVVLFKVAGDYHFGIYLEYGRVLGMEVPVKYGVSTSSIFHKRFWIKGFVYGFKRE